jgi:hypothetical protein
MREDLLPTSYSGCLTRLIEESSEAIQAIAKIHQYGPRPTDAKTGIGYDNVRDMLGEFNDIEHAARSIVTYYQHRHIASDDHYHASTVRDTTEEAAQLRILAKAATTIHAAVILRQWGDCGHDTTNNSILILLSNIHAFTAEIAALRVYYKSFGIEVVASTIPHTVIVG